MKIESNILNTKAKSKIGSLENVGEEIGNGDNKVGLIHSNMLIKKFEVQQAMSLMRY